MKIISIKNKRFASPTSNEDYYQITYEVKGITLKQNVLLDTVGMTSDFHATVKPLLAVVI